MAPHVSYLGDLAGIRWKSAAHITGGGVLGNLPRCLPDGVGARLARREWRIPPVFELIRKRGEIDDEEMYGTFNMSLGLLVGVKGEEAPFSATGYGQDV